MLQCWLRKKIQKIFHILVRFEMYINSDPESLHWNSEM